MDALNDFVTESLRIDGILRPPSIAEMEATKAFLALPKLIIEEVIKFVKVFQPNAELRDKKGMDVRVGDHIPIPGGSAVPRELKRILTWANRSNGTNMWLLHCEYESLDPFLSGNGCSGRAIWLWQWMRTGRDIPRSFLHQAYYQALDSDR